MRWQPIGQLFICEGGPLGTVALPEQFTNLGAPPAGHPLTYEVLSDLVAVVMAIGSKQGIAKETASR